MARIFITGSADGLGQLAAKELVTLGHQVVLHARNEDRGKTAMQKTSGAKTVLTGDLSSINEIKLLATKANDSGPFDAVIHNAAVYHTPINDVGPDGLPVMLTVNTLAPYILTCLMIKPKRLVYMSSGMHFQGDATLQNLRGNKIHANYSDTKLHDLILSMAVARKWKDVYVNAVNPGWVPTKMGGASAPDSLEKGYQTQVWLAASEDSQAKVSGYYFKHKKIVECLIRAKDTDVQERLLQLCKSLTEIDFDKF